MKTAQIFQDGQNQAVRLPEDFHLPGQQVYIKKVGNVIVLLPTEDPWRIFFDSLNQFTDDYLTDRNQPQGQEREALFV